MAIIFKDQLLTDSLLFAYNNNIVRFNSNSSLSVKNCQITITRGSFNLTDAIIIYPNFQGQFYFNFREWIKSLINTNELGQDWVFDEYYKSGGSANILDFISIVYKINFTNNTSENFTLNNNFFLFAYSNKKFEKIIKDDFCVLTPHKIGSKKAFIKIWQGYPLDITVYLGSYMNRLLTFVNTDLYEIGYSGSDDQIHSRFILSDYQLTDFIDTMSLFSKEKDSFNIIYDNNSTSDFLFNLEVDLVKTNCNDGHYLRWLNHLGGWNYWLFNRGDTNRSLKGLGEIDNDFNTLEKTLSFTENIGFNSNDVISVFETFYENDIVLISDLIESSKVYLFTGDPNTSYNYLDWIEVKIKDKTNLIQDKRYSSIRYQLDIELPNRITRTL